MNNKINNKITNLQAALILLFFAALIAYIVWFFATYPDEKRACEDRGGVMVRGDGMDNFHGYVCVEGSDD